MQALQPGTVLHVRTALAVAVLAAASACMHGLAPSGPSGPYPPFNAVAIVSEGPSQELKARFGVTEETSRRPVSTGVGFGAGTAAGIGAALTCGPFALLCATLTVPAGALIGTVGGNIAGAAIDAGAKPPEDQLLVLDGLFVELAQNRVVYRELHDALERGIPAGRVSTLDQADVLLNLVLTDVRFTETADGYYALTLASRLEAEWTSSLHHMPYAKRDYSYSSRSMPLSNWIADDGLTLNRGFDACIDGLAGAMLKDLRFAKRPEDTEIF